MLNKIDLAKARIALHCGFIISLTSKLQFIEDEAIPTAATDGRHVFWNRKFVESLTLGQVIWLVVHEVVHNMLAHMARLGGRDMKRANIAMDVVDNRMVRKLAAEFPNLGMEPPPGLIGLNAKCDKYEGWNWEKIYDDQDLEKNAGKKQFDEVRPGADEHGKPVSAEEQEALAKEWAMAAQQAATMAKSRGKMPGMFEDLVREMVTPKVDWRSQVWDAFTRISKDEQSWRRFNRRYIHRGLYLPGRYSEHLGFVGFYVDTSGSMGSAEFKLAMGAINEVMEDLQPERIMFGQCDTRIQSAEMVTPDDLPLGAVKFKGRGGTELTPIFEHVRTLEEEPELVVCLTDGYHEVIDKKWEPSCPVVWLITTSSVEAANASFGRVIRVEVCDDN